MRTIVKQVAVPAAIDAVWTSWTTAAGVCEMGPPEAWVEPRVGGAYEWYFMPEAPPGLRGAERCRILALLPPRLLVFSWNAPPTIPRLRAAGARTQVILELEDRGPRTGLRLTQLIDGTGEDWDAYIDYFDAAWGRVLDNLLSNHG